MVISLGPETAAYRFLHEHVVFFRGLRALSRFSIVPVLSLCVTTGIALSGRPVLTLVALFAGVIEVWPAPLAVVGWDGPSAAARWLAGHEGGVLYWPLGADDTRAMLESTAHFRPLVNGDSGVIPRPYDRMLELLSTPPSQDALRFLRAIGVRHIVAREDLSLPEQARFRDERIYEIPPGEKAVLPEEAGVTPTTTDGTVVDLGTERTVRALSFELSDGAWLDPVTLDVWPRDATVPAVVHARASLAEATLALLRNPRNGRAQIRFEPPLAARRIVLPPTLPARPGTLRVEFETPSSRGK
jgi:hypothetical protein